MPPPTATFTTEFRHEIDAEQSRWLRRRFLWYSGVVGVLGVLGVIAQAASLVVARFDPMPSMNPPAIVVQLVIGIVSVGVYVWAFLKVWRHALPRPKIVALVSGLILSIGVLSIIQTPLTVEMVGEEKIIKSVVDARQARAKEQAKADDEVGSSEVPAGETPSAESSAPVASEADVESTTSEATPAESRAEVKFGSGMSIGLSADGIEKRPPKAVAASMVAAGGLASIFVTHLFACLFMPLTPRESVRPVWPLLLLNGAMMVYYAPLAALAYVVVAVSPLVAVPGLAICWWRQSRFKDRFTTKMVKTRYTELKQELTSARQIHESLFPRPIADGPLRFTFRYEPMRSIGGDYLYARRAGTAERPLLHVVILDVTGHGITAALTVNRLHGEIDRQFGVNPELSPGELLVGLNAYLHHSLAIHSVYATALCMTFDAGRGEVRWASAGHPPAFLRAVDGTVQRLDPTTLVLGACKGDDFPAAEESARFGPGDMVIAYTDGAIEARNDQGKMLMLAGFERLVASLRDEHAPARGACGAACEAVLRGVDAHRFGPLQDDTLIVEISRGL